MLSPPEPSPRFSARLSRLGSLRRLDLNNLCCDLPEGFRNASEEVRGQWLKGVNSFFVEAMSWTAEALGGSFKSFAEWTYFAFPDDRLTGQDIREKRRSRFGKGYRAAISSLKWSREDSPVTANIQAIAYFLDDEEDEFTQRLWRPEGYYDAEMFAVAPAVIIETPQFKILHIAGLLGMDENQEVVHADNPGKQFEFIIKHLIAAVEQAGGNASHLVKLRTFASPELHPLLLETIDKVFQGSPPTVLGADNHSWGEKLHTEVQAMALIPKTADTEIKNKGLTAEQGVGRSICIKGNDYGLLSISELHAKRATGPVDAIIEICQTTAELLQENGFDKAHLNCVMVYIGQTMTSDELNKVVTAFNEYFPPEALHLAPCPDMPGLKGCPVKAEISASY